MSNMPAVSIDYEADAAYLKLSDGRVASTRDLTDHVMVDLDEYDVVVGVELLSLSAQLPLERLTTEFHVPSDQLDLLRMFRRESIVGRLRSAAEGTSVTRDDNNLQVA